MPLRTWRWSRQRPPRRGVVAGSSGASRSHSSSVISNRRFMASFYRNPSSQPNRRRSGKHALASGIGLPYGCTGPVVAVAPDGRQVAVVDGSGESAVIQALDRGSARPLKIVAPILDYAYGPRVWDLTGQRVVLPVSPPAGGSGVSAPSGLPSAFRPGPREKAATSSPPPGGAVTVAPSRS